MNLYFLGLLKPDKKREKNIANVYLVDVEENFTPRFPFFEPVPPDNLDDRFPFLDYGDVIKTSRGSVYIRRKDERLIHPYFYSYYEGEITNYLTKTYQLPLSLSKLQIATTQKRGRTFSKYLVPRFKMGKRKYDITITLGRYDRHSSRLSILKNRMKRGERCTIINPITYQNRQKTNLHLQF